MAAYCCLCLDDLNGEDCEDVACEAAPCGHVFHKYARRHRILCAAPRSCAVSRAPGEDGANVDGEGFGRGRGLTRETGMGSCAFAGHVFAAR